MAGKTLKTSSESNKIKSSKNNNKIWGKPHLLSIKVLSHLGIKVNFNIKLKNYGNATSTWLCYRIFKWGTSMLSVTKTNRSYENK